jgi:hypothetical protein
MQFDPAGYFKVLGKSLGLGGATPDGIVPPDATTMPPAGITNLGIMQEKPGTQFMQNPGGWLAEKLGQSTTSQAEHEMRMQNGQPTDGLPSLSHNAPLRDPSLGKWDNLSLDEALGGHIVDPVKQKAQEFDTEEKSKAEEEKNNKIVPPELKEVAKEGKVKDLDMSTMLKLIPQGINPLTDPKKFLSYFDATAEQNNIARSWGPLEGIRNLISDDAHALRARQQGLLQVGTFLTQKILENDASRLGAPKTAGDVSSLGGMVPLTPGQQQQKIEAPTAPGMVGPGQGIQDPNVQLQPWQQDQAMNVLKSLAGGHVMQDQGQIVPTSLVAQQGRAIQPQMAVELDRAARAPYDQDIQPFSSPVPVAALDKVIGERASMARDAAKDKRASEKGPEVEKRLEALALVESQKKYGKSMSYTQLAAQDPDLAGRLYKQAHVDEPKEVYAAEELMRRQGQVAVAGPVVTAQEEAKRDQPIAEPQLWRDPYTGKAASATMTTRQAQEQKLVKLRPDQVETVNQLATIDEGLERVKEISKRILRPEKGSLAANTLSALGQTAYLAMLRMSGNKDIVELDQRITMLTAPLVKAQGDTANIAVAEREMIKQALVNNQASAEAVVSNLEGLQESIKKARGMMGFGDVRELVERMLDAGMNEAEIRKALDKKGLLKKKK